MRTETALSLIHDREADLVGALEDERSQGWPAPFDWAAWRRNRANLVSALRSHTYWSEKHRRIVEGAEREYPDSELANDELIVNRAVQRFGGGRIELPHTVIHNLGTE